MQKRACLEKKLTALAPAVIALSGGTDSSTLLALAAGLDIRIAAVSIDTGLNPAGETERAGALARHYGIQHEILSLPVLEDPDIRHNTGQRCYICKRAMMEALRAWASAHGFSTVMDGTHADDHPEERPGMRALQELSINSPFAECGIGRAGILELAEEMNLGTIPSSSCLATRFPEGVKLRPEAIERVRMAEALLRPYATGRLRIRYRGDLAIIEVEPGEAEKIAGFTEDVKALGFREITITERKR